MCHLPEAVTSLFIKSNEMKDHFTLLESESLSIGSFLHDGKCLFKIRILGYRCCILHKRLN